MFVLRAVRFKNVYDGGIVLVPTHKTDVRGFVNMEYDNIEGKGCINSSVNIMRSSVQISLRLTKSLFELDGDMLYDISITPWRVDTKMLKMVYKLKKIVISNDVVDKGDVEEEDEVILDSYEIKDMYDSARRELEDKLSEMEDDIEKVKKRLGKMDINLENLNIIAEINTNFDRNILKNYI